MVEKKPVLKTPKTIGGILPIAAILPLIGKALLAGAVSDAASYGTQKLLKVGKGLYMRPYKCGLGIQGKQKKQNKKETSINPNWPNRPLMDVDLRTYAKNIPHVHGVFMRNNLPKHRLLNECAIVN